jgi:hypothetical protein
VGSSRISQCEFDELPEFSRALWKPSTSRWKMPAVAGPANKRLEPADDCQVIAGRTVRMVIEP